ncbi:MAG: hypothetical protein OXH04_09180 [Acidobacteria bacterium]|nr:hypothetical protein [Acidobacteriota bacterium]
MSVIVSEVYDALLEAGASEEKARAAAAAIPPGGQVATQQDVLELKAEIAVLRFAVFTFGPLILALLIKLVFFPWESASQIVEDGIVVTAQPPNVPVRKH